MPTLYYTMKDSTALNLLPTRSTHYTIQTCITPNIIQIMPTHTSVLRPPYSTSYKYDAQMSMSPKTPEDGPVSLTLVSGGGLPTYQ